MIATTVAGDRQESLGTWEVCTTCQAGRDEPSLLLFGSPRFSRDYARTGHPGFGYVGRLPALGWLEPVQ
jgi:hypothetical protein